MRMLKPSALVGAALIAAALPLSSAAAQSLGDLRERYMLPDLPDLGTELRTLTDRSTPGSNAGSPSAFGPNWGDAFIGGGGAVNRYSGGQEFRDRIDGSIVVGFGLGNGQELIGLEADIVSLGTFDSGGRDRFAFNFKAHRSITPTTAIAVGINNAFTTGFTDSPENSIYGVVSHIEALREVYEPFSTITVSAGLGNGQFLPEDDALARNDGINVFGSIGIRVLEPISLIADWTGQDLILAASLVPFRSIPIVITPGIADVTGNAGDGARFTIGAGAGFQF